MFASFALSYGQIVAIAVAAIAVLVLLFPGTRRALILLWIEAQGWLDARSLSKQHESAVKDAVTERRKRFKNQCERVFDSWFEHRRSQIESLSTRYNDGLTLLESLGQKIVELRAAPQDSTSRDMKQYVPLGAATYRITQGLLGCGEMMLTYLAFQLFHLSPIYMIVIVAFSGVVGYFIGHFGGHAFYRRQTWPAVIWSLVGFIYCMGLGVTRYQWLINHGDFGSRATTDLVAAFSWPIICVIASIAVGTQVRYLSAIEQALLDERRAKEKCNRLNQKGIALQKALLDAMEARRRDKTTEIGAYNRGFSFGWKKQPLTFEAVQIDVPQEKVDNLWPPERSESSQAASGRLNPSRG